MVESDRHDGNKLMKVLALFPLTIARLAFINWRTYFCYHSGILESYFNLDFLHVVYKKYCSDLFLSKVSCMQLALLLLLVHNSTSCLKDYFNLQIVRFHNICIYLHTYSVFIRYEGNKKIKQKEMAPSETAESWKFQFDFLQNGR